MIVAHNSRNKTIENMENLTATATKEDQVTTTRSILTHLVEEIATMVGEIAKSHACNIGSNIKDALLYDSADGECSLLELIDHKPAIILTFNSDMCQNSYNELTLYNDLLAAEKERINLLIIANDKRTATSCMVTEVMDEGMEMEAAMLREKSNLEFDLEVDVDILPDNNPQLYTLLADINHNFAQKHGLIYTISEEIKDIFTNELTLTLEGELSEEDMVLPAIYIVNKDGIICYASINNKPEERPDPKEILEIYRHLIS